MNTPLEKMIQYARLIGKLDGLIDMLRLKLGWQYSHLRIAGADAYALKELRNTMRLTNKARKEIVNGLS